MSCGEPKDCNSCEHRNQPVHPIYVSSEIEVQKIRDKANAIAKDMETDLKKNEFIEYDYYIGRLKQL